jgi:predicted NAD/FAD-dependent oxidoreductase
VRQKVPGDSLQNQLFFDILKVSGAEPGSPLLCDVIGTTQEPDMNTSHNRMSESAGRAQNSVGVVGAGISGLAAARQLADHGLQVQVFDKARGVGGRTSVRREGDLHFDHGAQYFTARDECFRRRVATWVDAGIVREWQGRIVAIVNGRVCASESQQRYVGVPGMNAITKHLANTQPVTTGTRVVSMKRCGDRWLLLGEANQELGRFEALIVAVPAAQAAELLTDLPELAEPARACQLAPCWAVMAAFEARLEVPFDGAFVHDSPLAWIARNNSKPGRTRSECWVLHASPEWSAEHLEDAPKSVCSDLLAALERAVVVGKVPIIHSSAHRWRYALPVEPLSIGCMWDKAARVAVCGDWCQGARIEGAFLSGLAAAERIMTAVGVPPNSK